uniref:Uncharacterized protein n=1 Tax=Populus trichocarpa TaxID=3694 RepID=A0A3N7GBY7_POPTR
MQAFFPRQTTMTMQARDAFDYRGDFPVSKVEPLYMSELRILVPSSPRIKIRSGAVKSKRMICCKHSWRGGDPCVCNYKE